MGIKILLADDSITIQKVVGIIFGGDDYALTVVDNGKDALDKAREIVPDVLLIDAVMPGMNGYEVCEAVRATPALAAKPILLLTGSFEPFDENKAKSCGADDFLAKPFESQQIVTKVKTLVEQGSSYASAAAVLQPVQEPVQEAPAFQAPPEPEPLETPAAPGDIWGAFTPAEEPAPAVEAAPAAAFEPAPAEEHGDVFTVVTEETEFETVEPPPAEAHEETTGSQWIPVEEQTFEFTPEPAAKAPAAAFSEPLAAPAQETAYGDIAPEESAQQAEPFEAAPSVAPPMREPFAAPAAAPAMADAAPLAAMSEEQLRAAITGASREVIERIVWEIVPDLAETMIRDAILRIQEGR